MNKKYMKPTITLVTAEASNFCAGSGERTWHVDPTHEDDYEHGTGTPDNNWGQIISDKGEGNMGGYDPWDSDNW